MTNFRNQFHKFEYQKERMLCPLDRTQCTILRETSPFDRRNQLEQVYTCGPASFHGHWLWGKCKVTIFLLLFRKLNKKLYKKEISHNKPTIKLHFRRSFKPRTPDLKLSMRSFHFLGVGGRWHKLSYSNLKSKLFMSSLYLQREKTIPTRYEV